MGKDPSFPFYAQDFLTLTNRFISDDWKTPNTYDSNYGRPSNKEGVYCFVTVNLLTQDFKTLYIGRSFDLKTRHVSHPVFRVMRSISNKDDVIVLWFKECNSSIELEKKLINNVKPVLNTYYK